MNKDIKNKIIKTSVFVLSIALLIITGFLYDIKKDSAILNPVGVTTFSGETPNLGRYDKFLPFKLEGWNSGWYTSPEYDGDDFPNDGLVESKNIDMGIKKSIAPRQGSEILGTSTTTQEKILSLYTAHTLDGRELLLRTSTTTVEWWNSVAETWETLESGFTADQRFSFVDGSNSSESWNYTYYVNGKEAIRRFRTAFGTVSTNNATTITLNAVSSYDSADDIGFNASGGTITVDGTNYTYTGLTGWQLTGLSGLPTFSSNEGVIEAASTSGFTSAPSTANAMLIKNQRMYLAYNNTVYASKIDDLQDFSYSSPRVAAEGETIIFPEGGQKITALANRQKYVAVFKNNYIGSLEFKDFSDNLSDIPVVNTISQGIEIGATNKNAVTQKDSSVMFVNDDIGITELTRMENKSYDQSIALSERIRLTLNDYDFSDSAIVYFKNKIFASAKKDDATFNNTVVVYDVLYNRFTEFQGWNVNAWAVYNSELYYGDALTKNVYKVLTSEYNDNGNPISVSAKTKWYNLGEPSRWKEIGWVWVEGFITQNTSIDFKINFDEGGDLASKTVTISGDGDYVADSTDDGFGLNPFGLSNFGTTSDEDALRHFSGWISLQDVYDKKWRNIQFEITSSGTGQNFRISKIYPYVFVLDAQYSREFTERIIND